MKKKYTVPEFKVVKFESENIITSSGMETKDKTLTKDSLLIYDF